MKTSQTLCKTELEHYNLIPRKYHGQVFTTDPKVIDQFIETVKSVYRPGTKIVEIGGGLGYLTEPLVRHFDDVDCLEIDDDLFNILTAKFCQPDNVYRSDRSGGMNKKFIQKKYPSSNNLIVQNIDILSNNKLVHKDFLFKNSVKNENLNNKNSQSCICKNKDDSTIELITNKKIIQKNGFRLIKEDILEYKPPKSDYLLVGNIPFHLSGRLYRKFMSDLKHKPYGMVFITDKQYAKTLMGLPPRCYRVSLQAQAYGKIEIVADVPPASVYPPPKVTCCIMKIIHSPTPLPENFWKVVNYHFENFPTKEVESPKTLSLKDWIEMAKKSFGRKLG